jgi:cob(I)alamin adenosyltransferase
LRIYTRTGDSGDTGLFGGGRVSKDDLRVEAYGSVDELNASLGVAAAACDDPDLSALIRRLQSELFVLGGDLATPGTDDETRGRSTVSRVAEEMVAALEPEIDRLEAELSPLRNFILPGGSDLAAALHLSRTVCRRAERRCVTLLHHEEMNPQVVRYLNRLSDLIFVMARAANLRSGATDVPWRS